MPHEETRKIIRVGTTSYAIILPKAWIRYNKLSAKDKLKVISNSNITIELLQTQKKVTVERGTA